MKKISLLLAASAIFAGASFAEDITSEVVKTEVVNVNNGGTLNVIGSNAKLIFDSSISGVQYALDIKYGGEMYVSDGALVDMNSVQKDFKVIRVGGYLQVDTGAKIRTNKITIADNGEFNLAQANAISASSLANPYLTFAGGANLLTLRASQTFILDIRTTSNATMTIFPEAVLTVSNWYVHTNVSDSADPTVVYLNDFVSNSIFLADSSNTAYSISEDGVLTVTYTEGTTVKKQRFSFLDAYDNVLAMKLVDAEGGKYLSTAIPEPAEWAAIFGAIALGLAVYRRRR